MRYKLIKAAMNDKRPHLIIYIRWGLIHCYYIVSKAFYAASDELRYINEYQ